ncbi:MAG: putative DNA binding domain-containing protein [Ruminococcus sp.]|nr:putative DNA binding domain-containing protein [Ruminococcus sp.]
MNIGFKEDLLNEFKSDRDKLSDDIIVEVVVAFSNTEGGKFYLGVEDNGEISGLHKAHKNSSGLAALIANRTVPPVSVDVENKQDYIVITVRKSRSIIAASSGKILRRRLKANGEPENAPMYPHEINTRLSTLNMLDYSALAVPNAVYEDLDSNERERLRDIIKKYSGEKNLLELDDEELDKALRLVVHDGDRVVPTYCGLLLIGKAERIQELMPTARSVFQVLSGTDVVFNEEVNGALLSVFEKMETYMTARNSEAEIEEGLFRISVFDFDKRAFREALVNAFCHRDYTMLGRVRVEINDDGLVISNPGGFVEGVNINNLLTAEPHGRNPALADVMKRIGLAERTGRGIDRIFEGSLLYGKPMPDYSESTDTLVKLFIPRGLPDKAFAKMISDEQGRIGRALPINSLLILNELKRSSRSTIAELSETIHSSESKTKSAVEKLVESGMLEAVGTGKGRYYTLSVQVYRRNKTTAEYVRQRGISEVRHPEMIIELAAKNDGKITRADVIELLKIDENRAYRALKDLVSQGKLRPEGKGRYSYYVLIK